VGIHADTLEIIGGELCLAFTDTVDWRKSDHPEDLLTSYADLVRWGQEAGALTDEDAACLLQQAERRPAEANVVLERAIVLREAMYRIFEAVADERSPAPEDLDILNGTLSGALARLRLVPATEGLAWDWADRDRALDRMLWPVVRWAVDLLTSRRLERVGQCPGCGWLFLDHSRNHSRRWCTMEVCGNRAKARRHHERQKERSGRPRACTSGDDRAGA
jgi:predicted RNA-binding Zn ribbon-like protein